MEEVWSTDYDGTRRRCKKLLCEFCKKEFLVPKHRNNKCCSRACNSKLNRKPVYCSCSVYNKIIIRNPSKLKNSKSGLYFCSRICKEKAQSLGGIKEIQPDHYGTGISSYRRIAFKEFENKCQRCGYDKYSICEVHHKDRNRENNDLSNLEVLCPNCHAEEHFLAKDGRWGRGTA